MRSLKTSISLQQKSIKPWANDIAQDSPGNIDTAGVLEALHGGADGGFELDDPDTSLQGLGVDDDLHVQGVGLDAALDGLQVHPQVVGVEVLELLDRLEVLFALLWNLGDLQKSKLALVL